MQDPRSYAAGIERAEDFARRMYADAAGLDHRADRDADRARSLAQAHREDPFAYPDAGRKAEELRDRLTVDRGRAAEARAQADRELTIAYGEAPWMPDSGPAYAAELCENPPERPDGCTPKGAPMYPRTRAGQYPGGARGVTYRTAYQRAELWRDAEQHAAAGSRRVIARAMPNPAS